MKIKSGKMPEDFWNYLVNPIVGFYIEKEDYHSRKIEKKYNRLPQSLNK